VVRLRRGQLRYFAFAFVGASLLAKAACLPTCFSLMYSIQTVGASLLAKAASQPTIFFLMYINPVGAGLPAKAAG
jgi:hypothetical protein